ncbi:MAG: type IV secretory system conjugative DNA transfer family protein [Solirubrobacteraceae bacterium]
MGSHADRHATGPSTLSPLLTGTLALVALAAVAGEAAAQGGAAVDHWRHRPPVDPLALVLDLADGRTRWPTAGTPILIAAAGVCAIVVIGFLLARARRRPATGADRAARLLATGRSVHPISRGNAQATARRFGVEQPGLPIARAVAGGQTLYATWEDMQCDIWGPRKGKSSSRAIPTLLAAPGAAFATSNKPDLYSATRMTRERSGRIWNFDPEAIAAGDADWWWNPLSYVTSDRRALELTDAFVGAYRDPDARPDPFFDPAGQELVSHLLRAAAIDGRPVTQAFLWSTRPNDDEPARILQDHGLELAAASVLDHIHAPFEQRGGVYGTARQILSFLRDPDIARWVTSSGTADRRRQLDLAAFVESSETLYLHSKEGQGSSAGLVTALAMALCDAAEQLAKRSPGGRLAVPLVGVLDEAANICRWRQLPDLYSHYGSRGIPLLTLLQSWSQGAQVWGPTGMRKLWGASNVRVYGGGAAEEDFLSDLEKLIGEYNRLVASPSAVRAPGGGSTSTSWQLTPTPILTVADLAALPRDRIIVMPSGAQPVLAEPVYWWNTRQADRIRESIATYDPPQVLARRHTPQPAREASWTTPA